MKTYKRGDKILVNGVERVITTAYAQKEGLEPHTFHFDERIDGEHVGKADNVWFLFRPNQRPCLVSVYTRYDIGAE